MGNHHHTQQHAFSSKFLQCVILFSFIHLLFLAPFLVTSQQGDGVTITLADFQVLQAIKRELIDSRGTLKSWNNTRVGACSGDWAGIKCANGQVIALQLPFKALGGRISSKIGLLKGLRKLSLHDNLISGTIPSSIGSLPSLRGLYLFNNRLSGTIPPSIGTSPQLQAVDLSGNNLTGGIPTTFVDSPRIHRLNLSYNALSGPVPERFSLSPSLTFLALQHNNLSGPIPDTWGKGSKGVFQLRSLTLEYNSLSGTIPHSLGKLGNLEELNLSHNKLNGAIPDEITWLTKLRVLDLSNNGFNGSFPEGFDNLKSLSSLDLKANHLTGPISASIGNLSSISALDLSQNNFTGEIPASFENLSNLTSFNVSYNSLSGQVPSHLSKKFNSSSFVGNLQLCGFSATTPCPSPPPLSESPAPSAEPITVPKRHRKTSRTKDIILIIVGILLAILLALCCVLLCILVRKRTGAKAKKNGKAAGGAGGAAAAGAEAGTTGGKLVLFDGPFVFTADDLLCATAEIMGKSPYGTVYKATLEDGNQVAVKRLREKLAKGPKEFELEVAALGRIRQQNLLPLRAYYLGPKGEKLLVYDYLSKGSLSSFLHARGPELPVDWPTRMKIAMGITRGLNHLHTQENIVHGNLTTSFIYLDEQNNAKISDYGVHRLMTDTANTNVIATAGSTGYRAPELPKTKKSSTKTDIYSLGVILIELLTGKSPSEAIDGVDLPQWVASTVKEEWTNEVFDLELMKDVSTTGDEMLNTLKLALHLVDPSPDARPEAQDVLKQLAEINPKLAAETTEEPAEESHH